MKICFPVRKQNGSQYSTPEEVMDLIGREPHGSWLAGTNQLWHGGIHISQTSAPGSVLTADNADTAVPLQCMAKGEVVAWRLNQDYKKADYSGKELKFSTTFVLVKSRCQPDPEKESSWLEFYSLYMGLAPLSVFPKSPCFKARTDVVKHTASSFATSTSSDGIAPISGNCGELKKDQRVIIQKQQQFRNKGVVQPFGLAKTLSASGEATGEDFWVTLLPEYMEPDGEQYAQLPAWMQKAVEQNSFDSVTKPATSFDIEAGDAIGFLGEDIAPASKSNTTSCHYAHIEVISTDLRMPTFLNNPAGVTSGQKYIRLHPGADLYTKSGEGEQSVFTKTTSKTEKDSGKILRVADCSPFEDTGKKCWFKISDNSWVGQDGVDQLHQYDLKERGFNTLEEAPSPDVSKSLRENWVKGAYDCMSEWVGKERGIQQKQVSTFYTNLIKKIDSDGDGELSGRELYNALHHPELGLRDIAARLIVKHDSEWFGGSSHHRWNVYFQNYDRLRVAYAKQWLDDSEWMSQVDAFNGGEPVWHFHPVMFLDALSILDNEYITVEQLKVMLPSNRWNFIDRYIVHLNESMKMFDINTPLRKSHFMAQVLHETGLFEDTEELASGSAYEGRIDLGNTQLGDGRLFKGRGLLQITGRTNYEACQAYLRHELHDQSIDITSSKSNAQKLSTNERYATLASGYYWHYIRPKLNTSADKDDMFWVSVYVNGWAVQSHPYYSNRQREPNHMQERINMLKITKKAFGIE